MYHLLSIWLEIWIMPKFGLLTTASQVNKNLRYFILLAFDNLEHNLR